MFSLLAGALGALKKLRMFGVVWSILSQSPGLDRLAMREKLLIASVVGQLHTFL